VPFDIDYEDTTPGNIISFHLKKGPQTLYGEDAEAIVRNRYGYVQGDIGRLQMQRQFLAVVAKKVTTAPMSKWSGILNEITKNVRTNMNSRDTVFFLKECYSADMSNMFFYTAPGGGITQGQFKWAFGLFEKELLEIVNERFNPRASLITSKNSDIVYVPYADAGIDPGGNNGKDIVDKPPDILR